MQAIIKARSEVGLELADVPRPNPGPRDVLIRVQKTGICGTDRHIYEWDAWAASRIKPPMVVGHEFVGIVADVGVGVKMVQPGDRVSGEGHIGCGYCYACRTGQSHICEKVDILGVDINGCFAPYVVLPESNIWKVDPAIPDDHACLFDPFGNAMHTVMAQPISGRQVLVVGCGSIGLMAVGILHVGGADLIIAIEPNPFKREIAKKMGADVVMEEIDPKEIKALTDRDGVDVVLEMSGNPKAIVKAFDCIRNGGDVALLGIPPGEVCITWAKQIIFRGLTIRGINGRRMYETWYQSERFLRHYPELIEPVITHRLPFDRFEDGIKAMQDGTGCKVVLDWTNAKE
ncbi:MAG: L-threonine 3-dehydrogenase [Planctomycetes bacterium]|nr:L-threonine 3-dehydrogenase [Planctomycetota bacterium]